MKSIRWMKRWKKFSKEHRLLPRTQQLLLAIAEGVLLPIEIADAIDWHRGAFMSGGLRYVRQLKREREERRLHYVLRALQRRKFIETRKKGDNMIIRMTEKGVAAVLHLQCRRAALCPRGSFVLVTFDVPEQEKMMRQQLRSFLAECGFQLLHKSVWRCDRDVLQYINDFIHRISAEEWVSVFRCLEV